MCFIVCWHSFSLRYHSNTTSGPILLCFICIHANESVPTGPSACFIYSRVQQKGMLSILSPKKKKTPKNQDIKYPCSFVFHSLHSQTHTDKAFPSRDLNLKQHMLGKCLTPQLYSLFSSPWILIVTVIIYWVITRCQKLLQVFQVLFCLILKEF